MLRTVLRSLRFRATTFAAVFLAMVAGAAIIMACGGLMETGVRAEVAPQRLSAAALVVTADQSYASETANEWARLDARSVERVRAIPGVAAAVGDISFPATVLQNGRPASPVSQGHGWGSAALAPYTLRSGTPPSAGEVVLDAALARRHGIELGDRVMVAVAGRLETFTSSGTAAVPQQLFFSAADAERLNPHPGQVGSIGIITEPGADLETVAEQVKTALQAGVLVLTGDRRGVAEHPEANVGANRLRIMAGVFSGWTVLVTGFGVASMVALSVRQRRREIALLRAIGATPRQIRRMIVGETLILAALATAVAYVPAQVLGRRLFELLTDNGVAIPALIFNQGWVPGIVGGFATIAAALAAALIAGRRAARIKPVQAIAEAAYQPHRLGRTRVAVAVLLLLGGLSQAVVTVLVMTGPLTAATAGPASVFVAAGLALLAPGIARYVVAKVAAPVARVTGLAGELAVQYARSQPTQFAAALAPVIMLTGVAVGTLYLQETEDAAHQRVFRDNLSADFVVLSSTGGFGPDIVERIRRMPGVRSASELVTGSARLEVPADRSQVGGWKVYGVNGAGSLAALTGAAAAIPERTAQAHGLRLGDPITIRFGDGTTAQLRLVSFFPAERANERIVVPAGLLARHTTTGLPTQILVRGDARPSDLANAAPGARVSDRESLVAGQSNLQRMLASANYAVVTMLLGFAALSVVNSLVAATARRRGDFGLLRLAGATRTQVLAAMAVEALLVAAIGTCLGTLASTATLVPFALVKNASPLPSGPPWIYLAVVGMAAVVTVAATLLPAWLVMRERAVDATRHGGLRARKSPTSCRRKRRACRGRRRAV